LNRTIIAHFSPWKGSAQATIVLLLGAAVVVLDLRHPAGTSWWTYNRPHGSAIGDLIVLLVAVPLGTSFALRQLWQMIFHQRRAVWLEGESLVILSPYISHFPVRQPVVDIVSAVAGYLGWFRRGVIVTRRDGTTMSITTWMMEETPEAVAENIEAALPAGSKQAA
jgi:hypothetical protein